MFSCCLWTKKDQFAISQGEMDRFYFNDPPLVHSIKSKRTGGLANIYSLYGNSIEPRRLVREVMKRGPTNSEKAIRSDGV